MSEVTPRLPSRSPPRTSGSRCRLIPTSSKGWPRSHRFLERALGEGDWLLLPTWANRMPTAASYLRQPGDTAYRAFKFDVLRIEKGVIAEITTFGPALFPAFGLAPIL